MSFQLNPKLLTGKELQVDLQAVAALRATELDEIYPQLAQRVTLLAKHSEKADDRIRTLEHELERLMEELEFTELRIP